MKFIVSQILGGIALILICISYFVKKKSHFLTLQIVADAFYASSYLLLDVFSAGVITLISIVRCVVIYFGEKYKKWIIIGIILRTYNRLERS